MTNPFQYGSVVVGDAFCNRRTELRDLQRAVENGEKMFVYSERRLGKTSLVQAVLNRLPRKGFVGVYVDLWPTDSEASFATATARAISRAVASTSSKMLETAGAADVSGQVSLLVLRGGPLSAGSHPGGPLDPLHPPAVSGCGQTH